MINVLASIYLKKNKFDEFMKIFKPNIKNVLAEKGCIEYLPTMDIDINDSVQELNENLITIIEKWETLDDLNKHASAPHMLAYQDKVKHLVDRVTIKALQEI